MWAGVGFSTHLNIHQRSESAQKTVSHLLHLQLFTHFVPISPSKHVSKLGLQLQQ
jgi:hypothetical protein